jgi:hypothetical protein
MLKEFKEFISRGNLVELAVAVILALAFKTVVDSVVADVFTRLSPPSSANPTSPRSRSRSAMVSSRSEASSTP